MTADPMPRLPTVKGVCPCCGESRLRLTEDGDVWCSNRECAGPYTVSNLLVETFHYVDVVDGGGGDESDSISYDPAVSTEHPLGCWVAGRKLLDCEVHRLIASDADAGNLPRPGRYKVTVFGTDALAWMREN